MRGTVTTAVGFATIEETMLFLGMAVMWLAATLLGVFKRIDRSVDLTPLLQLRLGCLVCTCQINRLIEGQRLGILVQ